MAIASAKKFILWGFFAWHYTTASRQILLVWSNYLRFYWEYFSVPLLIKTLLSPWHNQAETYSRGFDLKEYSTVFLGNLISRFLGAIVRTVVIIIGLLFSLAALLAGSFVFVLWLLWPLLFIFGAAIGVYLII
jgi:hypothetical protein